MATTNFENALTKIRPHTTSKQAHQRKPAQLLVALESTLQESSKASGTSERNPTAYFAALLTTLEGCLSQNDLDLEDGSTLPAILYLLALIFPFVPPAVLRAHLSKIFQLLPPLLPLATPSYPPSLRSLITAIGTALTSMDQGLVLSTISISNSFSTGATIGTGTSTAIRNTFATLLELVLDPRPKVRKRAGEAVKDVLESPPSPLAVHPWSSLVAEWSCGVVAQRSTETGEAGVESLIHLMAFLRTVPFIFTATSNSSKTDGSSEELRSVETMTRYLLVMPKLSNPYLTQASYQLLATLIDAELEDDLDENDVHTQRKIQQIATIQSTLLSSAPTKAEAQLGPYWLTVLARATIASRPTLRQGTPQRDVWQVWAAIWQYLDASCPPATRKAAGQALCDIINGGCISSRHLGGFFEPDGDQIARPIVDLIEKSLPQLAYASSIKEILEVSTALAAYSSPLNTSSTLTSSSLPLTPHQYTSPSHPFIPLLSIMVKLRGTKDFEYKDDIDKFLGAMMGAVGVNAVIERIPLGLLPSERTNSHFQPNAYLLPLIPSHHPTPLSHFVSYFIPLSEKLWELAEKSDKDAEKKVYKVLMEQIWNAFPSYCRGCWDVRQTFTPQLAERLTQVLYHEPTLRPAILRGLRAIVEGNQAAAQTQLGDDGPTDVTDNQHEMDDSEEVEKKQAKPAAVYKSLITVEEAKANISYLNSQTKSWLAVLFNVFTSMEKESRAMVGSVISVWAGIASEPELAGAYRNVLSHLTQNLAITGKKTSRNPASPESQKAIATLNQMLDILLLLVPFLPAAQLRQVVALFLEQDILDHSDGGVQKLGYRVLSRVIGIISKHQAFSLPEKNEIIEKVLAEVGNCEDISSGATKERLGLLSVLIENLAGTSLHLLVSHLMEPIMGVKEHSEKVRKASFELLVIMGNKMKQGGVVNMELVGGMSDSTESGNRTAGIEEFVRMVAASLAADRDHTISAGVMSLSRVLFEFRDDISEQVLTETVITVFPLVAVKNREIVKSVLGFVKLAIHSLPPSITEPQLPNLIPALLVCLSTHRHHFKVKVRHIFERLIRKFGSEEIERFALESGPEHEGAVKMILNIKKRKERAARKRDQATERGEEGSDEEPVQKPTTGDAFEDVLYGSESEVEDSETEEPRHGNGSSRQQSSNANKKTRAKISDGTRLRLDNDQPMDLLEGAAGQLIASNPRRHRKPGQDASKFKTDEDTGKMIIGDSDSDEGETNKPSVEDRLAGAAYKDTLVSVDGFTRNPNGTIKFHKDTKKRRKEEMEMGDMEVDDLEPRSKGGVGPERTKKRKDIRVGQEFKAKRAGGDVKKNGVDPYAYLTLGQTAGGRKGKGKAKVSILGKR